jgi:ankyrin repeat protein
LLYHAVFHGNMKLVEKLLQYGANLNSCGPYNWAPIHTAVYRVRPEIFQLLLEFDARINQDLRSGPPDVYDDTGARTAPIY